MLFIITSIAGDDVYKPGGYYYNLINNYQTTLSRFIGDTEVLTAGDTKQVNDYSRYEWTMFNADAKHEMHEARLAGKRMAEK